MAIVPADLPAPLIRAWLTHYRKPKRGSKSATRRSRAGGDRVRLHSADRRTLYAITIPHSGSIARVTPLGAMQPRWRECSGALHRASMAYTIVGIGISLRALVTTPTVHVQVELTPELLARLDSWIAEQPDAPSRSEALRQLASTMLDLLEAPVMGRRPLPKIS